MAPIPAEKSICQVSVLKLCPSLAIGSSAHSLPHAPGLVPGPGPGKDEGLWAEVKKCHGTKFETPTFSQENIERILDNLVLKIREKCSQGFIKNRDVAGPIVEEDVEGPHDTTHCEACALGICYLFTYRFVIPASLPATSQPGQLAWRGTDTESDWKLLCYMLPVLVALLILAVLFGGK
ncbi:unnamed protein product [Natator depressus]